MAAAPALHFVGGEASLDLEGVGQVSTDVQLLNALDAARLAECARTVLDFLANPKSVDLVAAAAAFAGAVRASEVAVKNAYRGLLVVLRGAVQRSLSEAQVVEDFAALGMSPANAAALGELWRERKDRLAYHAAASSLMARKLVDMKWSFGVTVGTHEVRQLGATYLQVRLTFDVGGGRLEHAFLELTLPQFYELLSELERAKTFVELLSTAA